VVETEELRDIDRRDPDSPLTIQSDAVLVCDERIVRDHRLRHASVLHCGIGAAPFRIRDASCPLHSSIVQPARGSAMVRRAVERRLGVIGEAFSRPEILEPGVLDQVPELRQVFDARNRVIRSCNAADVDFDCRHESS